MKNSFQSLPKKFENTEPNSLLQPENIEDSMESKLEKSDITKTEFFVTDHSLRHPESVSPERMREMYRELKKEGIESVRFDWDWQEVFPVSGQINQDILKKYTEAIEMMKEEGLKSPILVMSSPPIWATDLIKQNKKEEYFNAYEEYINSVADTIKNSGSRIEQAQLFNEINHPALFNFSGGMENFPKIAALARKAFTDRGIDIKLSTSIIVGNLAEKTATLMRKPHIDEFLDQLEKIKDSVDVISLDYYPGMWHLPIQGAHEQGDAFPIQKSGNPIKEFGNKINRTFKNVDMLKAVCERIATWNKEYEIAESGFPTNEPYSTGRRQRLQFDMYFRALRQMLVDFDARDIRLPTRIGIYEAQDEDNKLGAEADKNPLMKWIKKRKIFPESHFGLYDKNEQRKEILQGNLKGPQREDDESQIKKLIDYVRQPIQK